MVGGSVVGFQHQLDARTSGVSCNFWIFRQERPNRHPGASGLGFQAEGRNSASGKDGAFARLEHREDYGRDVSNITAGGRWPPLVMEHNPSFSMHSGPSV